MAERGLADESRRELLDCLRPRNGQTLAELSERQAMTVRREQTSRDPEGGQSRGCFEARPHACFSAEPR
jgi:hypothetical protein